MRMLSGRMHWLTVGLALLVSAQGFATKRLHGQALPPGMAGQMPYAGPPGMPAGMMPGGGMMGPDRPMSMAFPGPAPMDVTYASANVASYAMPGPGCGCGGSICGGMGCGMVGDGSGLLGRMDGGCGVCGGGMCGGRGCGPLSRIGTGAVGRALRGDGCAMCRGIGCGACGGGCGSLFSGGLLSLLGPLAPYSEGGQAGQRWFDVYAGTIGLARTSDVGGFSTSVRNPQDGTFPRYYDVSSNGIGGPIVLQSSDVALDDMKYGLEAIVALQLGPGTNLEARYFGLNKWDETRSVSVDPSGPPTLYSSYSQFGFAPPGGFDDTDRSFIHALDYSSEMHNGEVNYRRRFASPYGIGQGSWLAGIRYFDLDENFGFRAVGSNDDTFTFDQLRFFDHQTITRNQLTGFQIGGDYWLSVVPGIQLGVESKGGVFGNHAEVESQIFSNSIPGAREHLQDGETAYLSELVASAVYRVSYSLSVKASYNLLYIDNVALAPQNYNTRDLNNALGSGSGAFTADRFPYIDVDGEVLYQGWSIGGEYLW